MTAKKIAKKSADYSLQIVASAKALSANIAASMSENKKPKARTKFADLPMLAVFGCVTKEGYDLSIKTSNRSAVSLLNHSKSKPGKNQLVAPVQTEMALDFAPVGLADLRTSMREAIHNLCNSGCTKSASKVLKATIAKHKLAPTETPVTAAPTAPAEQAVVEQPTAA